MVFARVKRGGVKYGGTAGGCLRQAWAREAVASARRGSSRAVAWSPLPLDDRYRFCGLFQFSMVTSVPIGV